MRTGAAAAVVAIAMVIGSDAWAAQARPLDEVIACRAIGESEPRLRCYDQAASKLATATEKNDIVVVNREDVRQTRRSLFGFSLPKLSLLGNDGPEDETEEVRTLRTTLKSVRPTAYGLWTLVFAEGGTWQTTETSRQFEPEAGQSVVVKSGPLGGYMANVEGAKAVRVRRIN